MIPTPAKNALNNWLLKDGYEIDLIEIGTEFGFTIDISNANVELAEAHLKASINVNGND